MINSGNLHGNGESLYTMIVVAAKRARQLIDGDEPLIKATSTKPVSIAFEEISTGNVRWIKTQESTM